MAVFTQMSADDVSALLSQYAIGTLLRHDGIASGVENTTYKLETTQGPFILTVFENRRNDDNPALMGAFMQHMASHGVACPTFVADMTGKIVASVKGKQAAIQTFMSGQGIALDDVTTEQASQIGALLARMHKAGQDFALTRTNPVGFRAWQALAAKVLPQADTVEDGLSDLITQVLHDISPVFTQGYPQNLPHGAVHGDVFPDNTFFAGDTLSGIILSGIIDFGFMCYDSWLYDYCVTLHAWAFDAKGDCRHDISNALYQAYSSVRSFTPDESTALNKMGQAAALRILLTRLHDWLFPVAGATVKAKDPRPYAAIIRHYRVAA